MSVYQVLDVKRGIPAITPRDKAFSTQIEAVIKGFE